MIKTYDKSKTIYEEKWIEDATYENTVGLEDTSTDNRIYEKEKPTSRKIAESRLEYKVKIPKFIFPDSLSSSQILAKWEGTVIDVNDSAFYAKLRDLKENTSYVNEAEFPLEDLQNDDRELLRIGALFYWYVGYMTTSSGTRIKISLLQFKRLPRWQKSKMNKITEKIEKLRKKFGWI